MSDNFQDNVSYRSSTLGVSGDAVALGSAAGVKSIIFSNSDSVGHLVWQPSGNVTLSLPSGGGVVHVAGSAPGAIAAGTQTAVSGTIVYSNSNNVSFGMSGSTRITASYNFNISGGTTSNNLNSVIFSNSNNVSFGLDGSTMTATISVPAQTNQTLGLYAVSNTTGESSSTTRDARTLSFHGAGVASVGYSNGSVVISVPAGGGGITNVNLSAGTTSNNLSAFVFSNSNNVSFGLDGSTVTATVSQTNQTVGLYALGNTTQNSSTTLDARTLSFNGLGAATVGYSNGSIQVSVPVQTAQTQSNIQAIYDGANSISTGTIRFTNANGVSFSINGQTISGSVAAQTNQTVGLYAVSNTTGESSSTTCDARTLSFHGAGIASVGYSGGSVVISVPAGGGGITNVNLSAGTTSNNLSAFVFSNSNNVSFGLNGSTVTATATVSQTNQTVGLYAVGNTTQNSSTTRDARSISYNAIGALSVGYSNGSVQLSSPEVTSLTADGMITISTNANSATIGAAMNVSAGTTSNNVTALTFSNSNGVSFGLNGSVITASAAGGANINVSAGTTSNNLTNIVFSNSNGVSFGLNGSTVTGSVVAGGGTLGFYAVGNTTQNSSTTITAASISYNGLGAASVGYSNGSIQLSVPNVTNLTADGMITISTNANSATIGAAMNVSAGATSNNVTALTFSNSNNVSFGLNGSTVTASAHINVSAGTTSNNLRNITFDNANGIVFGLNASTITAGVASLNFFEPFQMFQSGSSGYAPGVGSIYIQPFVAPLNLKSGRINVLKRFSNSSAGILQASNSVSFVSNTTGSRAANFIYSKVMALYTQGTGTNDSRLESFWSNSWSLQLSHTVSVATGGATTISATNGASMSYIASVGTNGNYTTSSTTVSHSTSTAANSLGTTAISSGFSTIFNMISSELLVPVGFNTTLTPGNYWLAQVWLTSSTTAGTTANVWPFISQLAIYGATSMPHRLFGKTASSTTSQYWPGNGVFSATSAAVPSTIAFSDVRSFASHQTQYFNIMTSSAG